MEWNIGKGLKITPIFRHSKDIRKIITKTKRPPHPQLHRAGAPHSFRHLLKNHDTSLFAVQ